MDNNLSFVRTEMLQGQTPPLGERGIVRWMRTNLFATPLDTALTLLAILALAWFLPGIINWLFVNAVWSGPDRSVCSTVAQGGIQPEGWSGACWAYVNANFNQFMYGPYPVDQHWRVNLVAIIFVLLLVPLLIPKAPYKVLNAVVFFFIFPIVAFILLVGGWFGLPYVETSSWGGLLVTLTLSFVGIAVSLPLGIVLALGRRSKMPVIKMLCVIFIETIRGIPLITVLFMASYMLPLFLPPGVSFDKILARVDRRGTVRVGLYGRGGSRRSPGHSKRAI